MNIRSMRRGMDKEAHSKAKELVEKINKSMNGMKVPIEKRTSKVRARAMRKVFSRRSQQVKAA